MTSAINPALININYPIAGQDNDSQGFRDNFAEIAANFATAETEISALQTVALLKADIATQSNPVVNNLQGSTLSNGLYQQFSGTLYSASVSSTGSINLANGAVQKFTLSGNATLTFSNWPTPNGSSTIFSNVVVLIAGDGNGIWTPTFAATAGTVAFDKNFPLVEVSSGGGTTTKQGVTVGGESLVSVGLSGQGQGYVSAATVNITAPTMTNYVTPTATAKYTVVGASVNNIAPTSMAIATASGDGALVTLTFTNTTGLIYYPANSYVVVSGVTPSGYNGIFQVASSTATSITYRNKTTAAMTQAGVITAGNAGNGYAVGDTVSLRADSSVVFSVASLAKTFTGRVITTGNTISNVTNFTNLTNGMTLTGSGVPGGITISATNTGLGTVTVSGGSIPAGWYIFTYDNGNLVTTTGPIGSLTGTPVGTLTTPISAIQNTHSLTGNGTGAQFVASCGIGSITVTDPGDGYTTTPPIVTVVGGTNGASTDVATTTTAVITSGTGSKVHAIEAWTVDAGTHVFLRYLGQF